MDVGLIIIIFSLGIAVGIWIYIGIENSYFKIKRKNRDYRISRIEMSMAEFILYIEQQREDFISWLEEIPIGSTDVSIREKYSYDNFNIKPPIGLNYLYLSYNTRNYIFEKFKKIITEPAKINLKDKENFNG